MARRYDPSKLRRAISDYNSAVRRYNAEAQRRRSKLRGAVADYNRAVRSYNANVETQRRQLRAATHRLASGRVTVRSSVVYRSTSTLYQWYEQVAESSRGTWLEGRDDLLESAGREAQNSVDLTASLIGSDAHSDAPQQDTELGVERALASLGTDLRKRWQGAVFALNPQNPDAGRHFSASAREILSHLVEREATDDEVIAANPRAPRTEDGRPTRRSRLAYCLVRDGRASSELAAFADADIDNVLDLFSLLNAGTHENAGHYDIHFLGLVRRRVEGAIAFLHSILRT